MSKTFLIFLASTLSIIVICAIANKISKNRRYVKKLEAELDDISKQLQQTNSNTRKGILVAREHEIVTILKTDYAKTTRHKYDDYVFRHDEI